MFKLHIVFHFVKNTTLQVELEMEITRTVVSRLNNCAFSAVLAVLVTVQDLNIITHHNQPFLSQFFQNLFIIIIIIFMILLWCV